ncbi:MAG: hypothetical protein GX594_01490 [Pirellulaceae bacterium]|nr:hypothetical protein [Pirellulaceae bacterium]
MTAIIEPQPRCGFYANTRLLLAEWAFFRAERAKLAPYGIDFQPAEVKMERVKRFYILPPHNW